MKMTTAPGGVPRSSGSAATAHPVRTIRDIRESLPEDQARHFDVELADTELDALPEMLARWVRLATDDDGNRTRAPSLGSIGAPVA